MHSLGSSIRHRKLRNFLHSSLLIVGLITLSVALGWFVAGGVGIIFLGLTAVLIISFGPKISPAIILKMYLARPLTHHHAPRLLQIVGELSGRAGFAQTPPIFYVPSQMINAFTMGRHQEAVICVTDGLLRNLNTRDLAAVMAHEIAHIQNNDAWVMSVADMVSRIVSALSWVGQVLLFVNLPLLLMGRVTISWFFILLLVLAPTLSALLQLALSRSREFDADLGAAELTGDPRGLAEALAKLEQLQCGFWERIFFPGRRLPEPSLLRTHPNTDERISRLLELEGELFRERFLMEPQALPDLESKWETVVRRPRWHVGGLWH